MRFIIGALLGVAVLTAATSSRAVAVYADTVVSWSGGSGSGVYDLSGGAYTGATGLGVFDAAAVTTLDGAGWAMGSNPFGQIVLRFSGGAVIDGAGADLRAYDSFGLWEGVTVDASDDGASWVSLGTVAGDFSSCSPGAPCASGFDLAGSGLASASWFRLTAAPGVVFNYPEAYDLDALEASYFRVSAVPEPGALALVGLGLVGLTASRRRRLA